MIRAFTPAALFPILLLAACGSAPAPSTPFLALGIAHASEAPLPDTYCAGQPTEEQFAKLPGLGIRRVICLRPATEKGTGWEEAKAAELGIEFVRIPIAGAQDLTRENVEKLGAALAPQQRTLIACASSNRVGAMLALKAFQDGAPADKAMELGKQCGMTKLASAVAEKMAK